LPFANLTPPLADRFFIDTKSLSLSQFTLNRNFSLMIFGNHLRDRVTKLYKSD
jgi:hypothetical protein